MNTASSIPAWAAEHVKKSPGNLLRVCLKEKGWGLTRGRELSSLNKALGSIPMQ